MTSDLTDFAAFLNQNAINHIFLFNYLCDGKIDCATILIEHSQYERFACLLKDYEKCKFCFTNDICLYGLKKIISISLMNGLTLKAFSRPAIKSPDKKQYVPLNKNVEAYFWKYSTVVDGLKVLSNEDLFFMIICSNIFDNGVDGKGFNTRDINSLISLFKHSDSFTHTKEMFEVTFYKFTPTLFSLIENHQFDQIFHEYISFGDY